MRKIFNLKISAVLASVFLMCAPSCEDENVSEGTRSSSYYYEIDVPNANDDVYVVIDSVFARVKTIDNYPDWVEVAVLDTMRNGHPMLRLSVKPSGTEANNSGNVLLTAENGDKVTLTLKQSLRYVGGDNTSDLDFIQNWETLESTLILTKTGQLEVNLPWAKEVSTTIPQDIRMDVKKSNGWEMAYSSMNKKGLSDCNYFMLYNRYLGILRVFYYVTDAITASSNYSFEVDLGASGNNSSKYPFYHSLAYGIPSNHKSLSNTVDLIGVSCKPNTFKNIYTPFTTMSSPALMRGWTAFDIDMTAYCPSENKWTASTDQMSIFCKTTKEENLILSGTLNANIDGKYSTADLPEPATSAGITKFVQQLADKLGGSYICKGLDERERKIPNIPYVHYIAGGLNIAGYLLDKLLVNEYAGYVTDSMPGKISLNLTGKIDLSGYINSFASNNIPSLTINSTLFEDYNSHLGEGIWNLTADPVVYVVDDVMLGDVNTVNLVNNKNGTYSNNAVADYHLRMVSFLDPTSIELAINTDAFPDVSDVSVTCDYGVYPDVSAGHTAGYANLLGFKRPIVQIVKSGDQTSVYRSKNNNPTKYMKLPHTKFMSALMQETVDSCEVIKQNGADYYYYGKKVNPDGRAFIVSPQVYFPYNVTDTKSVVGNGVMPDFVVLVTVSFNSQGRSFLFSQRFIPKVVAISSDDLKQKKLQLEKFIVTCETGAYPSYLKNTEKIVGVKHFDGEASIQKTIDILRAVVNY